MEQPQQPAMPPESSSEQASVTISKKDHDFLQKMIEDTAFLAFHLESLVMTVVNSLPKKAKEAQRWPTAIEMGTMLPGLMKKIKDPIEEVMEHYPELERICQQYSRLHHERNS